MLLAPTPVPKLITQHGCFHGSAALECRQEGGEGRSCAPGRWKPQRSVGVGAGETGKAGQGFGYASGCFPWIVRGKIWAERGQELAEEGEVQFLSPALFVLRRISSA